MRRRHRSTFRYPGDVGERRRGEYSPAPGVLAEGLESTDLPGRRPRHLDIIDRFPVTVSTAGISTDERLIYRVPRNVQAILTELYISFNEPGMYGILRWRITVDEQPPRGYQVRSNAIPVGASVPASLLAANAMASWYPMSDTLDPVEMEVYLKDESRLRFRFESVINPTLSSPWTGTAIVRARITEYV